MKKDVMISLVGKQNDGEEQEKIELLTEGVYYSEDGKHFVTYDETEVTGFEGTTTTLQIEGERLTLVRSGQNNSQLIFEKGQRHLCCYETAYGVFTIGIRSSDVSINLGDSEGVVSAEYRVEIDNTASVYNDFKMQFREIKFENKFSN